MLSLKGLEQADLDLSPVNTFWCSVFFVLMLRQLYQYHKDVSDFFLKEIPVGTRELRQIIVAWIQQSPAILSCLKLNTSSVWWKFVFVS